MTREMKSSRVHRDSSSFICAHRSTAGGFGAAATTGGRSGTGAASLTTGGATGGAIFGAGAATAGLRVGFTGNGLISTGDVAAPAPAAPLAGGDPSAGEPVIGSGWRGGRCGVASGGNADMTLDSPSLAATAGTGVSAWRTFQNTNASSATTTHAPISSAAMPSRRGCDA